MNQDKNPQQIKSMFSKVAQQYDLANSVLSVGIHHLWRRKLVKLSGAQIGDTVLDCATGTGDLAIEFKRAVGNSGSVRGTDFCAEMLYLAPEKAVSKGLLINFQIADVTALPFENQRFDISSISFGIRNVVDTEKGIREMARVTKSGGQVMILEFGKIRTPVLGPLFNFYSQKLLPTIGGFITGQKQAYQYLQKSSADFPCGEDFKNYLLQTGVFSKVEWTPLSAGVAYIYKATVL